MDIALLWNLVVWLSGAAAFGVLLAYGHVLGKGFRAVQARPFPATEGREAISVVVPARNEQERLPCLLDALAVQSYSSFEVVVVDDGSTDETAACVERHASGTPRIRLVQTGPSPAGSKKDALAAGIRAARFDLLAFTDADCVPPPTWLEALARHHRAAPGSVLVGYGPFFREPTLLNRFARYETLVTAFLTCAGIGLGRPYMAVGRNLSYPRAVFDRVAGFDRFRRSLSGDDDLFVQEVARHGAAEVRYVLDPASFVYSAAPHTWKAWFRQKRRHTSAGRHYDRNVQRHLALLHASNLVVWVAPLVFGWAGVLLLGAKLALQSALLRRAARAFGEPFPGLAFPLLDGLYVAYNTLVAPVGLLFAPKRW